MNSTANGEATWENYRISTDKSQLNIPVIQHFLSASYWAAKRPPEKVIASIDHSICFGVYLILSGSEEANRQQVGFARVISDQATFAYLADVFIVEEHRGKGLSKWLMETIHAHPALQGLRRWILATRDAHGLYEQYGYQPLLHPGRWMEKFDASM